MLEEQSEKIKNSFGDLAKEQPIEFIKGLCEVCFRNDEGEPFKIYDYQAEIIKNIFFRENKRTLCWATTRAGKSLAIALGIILLVSFHKGRKVRIIAPTMTHSQVIMNYCIQHIMDTDYIKSRLLIDVDNVERLKKQITKSRITFQDECEIQIITASIASEGRSLVGFGGTDIFIDETELIPIEIIRSKVMRMLGDSTSSSIFMISNPHKKGFMYSKIDDPSWVKLKVGWEQCVKEGRFSKQYIDEMRSSMTPIEFTIWYDSEYPEDTDDTLIKLAWIEKAVRPIPSVLLKPFKICGADIAAGGVDSTVVMSVYKYETLYIINDIVDKNYGPEENQPTLKASDLIKAMNAKHNFDLINVDSVGVGKGVYETLLRDDITKFKTEGFVAGENKDLNEADRLRFSNKKAWAYVKLAKLFEEGRIIIPNHDKLKHELNSILFSIQEGSGKVMIDKRGKETKSPDFADALMMAVGTKDNTFILEIAEF